MLDQSSLALHKLSSYFGAHRKGSFTVSVQKKIYFQPEHVKGLF
jgi:hypothetical protein